MSVSRTLELLNSHSQSFHILGIEASEIIRVMGIYKVCRPTSTSHLLPASCLPFFIFPSVRKLLMKLVQVRQGFKTFISNWFNLLTLLYKTRPVEALLGVHMVRFA